MIYSNNSSAAVSAMEAHRLGEYPDEECEHISCECCGEKTGANWIRIVGGKKLCLDCYESYNRFCV